MRRPLIQAALALLAASSVVLAGCSGTSSSGSSGGSAQAGQTIKIGLITSMSGPQASTFGQPVVDAVNASFKLANDGGSLPGGAKLELVVGDDQSTPEGTLAAYKNLVGKDKIFALIESSTAFSAAEVLSTQQGLPVVGFPYDPGFGDPKNRNLFALWGSVAPNYPDFTGLSDYFKSKDAKSLCAIGTNHPTSVRGIDSVASSLQRGGMTVPLKSTTQALTDNDFTTTALSIKSSGCDVVIGVLTIAQDIGLMRAIKGANISLKASMIVGGVDQNLIDDPSNREAMQGFGLATQFQPPGLNTPGTQRMQAALKSITGSTNVYQGTVNGWFPAELLIHGLTLAGPQPTQAKFIDTLRGVKDFDYNGMTCPIDFAQFGNVPNIANSGCVWISEVQGSSFVPVTQQPIKLDIIPGTGSGS